MNMPASEKKVAAPAKLARMVPAAVLQWQAVVRQEPAAAKLMAARVSQPVRQFVALVLQRPKWKLAQVE